MIKKGFLTYLHTFWILCVKKIVELATLHTFLFYVHVPVLTVVVVVVVVVVVPLVGDGRDVGVVSGGATQLWAIWPAIVAIREN